MQFMAFHSRERLVEIFRDCYDDHRDVKPVLDMITTRAGYIKLIGQTLFVILDWIENKKYRKGLWVTKSWLLKAEKKLLRSMRRTKSGLTSCYWT